MDLSRIFTKSKLLRVRLHPLHFRFLHQCVSPIQYLTRRHPKVFGGSCYRRLALINPSNYELKYSNDGIFKMGAYFQLAIRVAPKTFSRLPVPTAWH